MNYNNPIDSVPRITPMAQNVDRRTGRTFPQTQFRKPRIRIETEEHDDPDTIIPRTGALPVRITKDLRPRAAVSRNSGRPNDDPRDTAQQMRSLGSDPRPTQPAYIIPRLLLQEIAAFRMCLARKPVCPGYAARRKVAIYATR